MTLDRPEDTQRVARVYAQALAERAAFRPLAEPERMVYEIEMLTQEVNSGASFEQYFRWASRDELLAVRERLHILGLGAVVEITQRAFAVAFPGGLPASDTAIEEAMRWTPDQLDQLRALATEFCACNGAITQALARFHRLQRAEA